jgi:hypothetical protein
MASHGSATFECYVRNLRRIYWSEFVDVQTQMSRTGGIQPAATATPTADKESLIPSYEYFRHRNLPET